jgi:acyl carrier protein
MTSNQLRTEVEQFIRTSFVFDKTRQVGEDESLLGSGIVDSTGVLELIAFLEDTYHVKFEDQELVAENFDSVAKVTTFVGKKLGLDA